MAFDPPRKTLDEIRREIDAEFAPPPLTDRPDEAGAERPRPEADIAERYAALDDLRRRFGRPRPHRGGYIIAGLVGCLIGQLALLGYLSVARYWGASAVTGVGAPVLRIATPPPPPPTPEPSVAAPRRDWHAIDVPATSEPVASQTESGPLETAASPSETVAIAPRTPDADVSQRSASALVPRLTIPAPLIEEPKPTQRRTGREPPPAAAPFIARSAPPAELRPPVRNSRIGRNLRRSCERH